MHRPHRLIGALAGCLAAAALSIVGAPSLAAQQPSSTPATLRGRGIDPAHMDTTCKACRDFYRYANGGWLAGNPIPADRSGWSSYDEAGDRTTALLHRILEDAARTAPSAPGTLEGRLGTFYAACMDSSRAEGEGVAPVAADLARIAAVRDRAGLLAELARLQRQGTGIPFAFFSSPDDRDASRTIAVAWQSGLTLPTREYYLREDSAARSQRAAFRDYATRMFVLAGTPEQRAREDADRVMEMETALARAALTPVQMRDPESVYHKMSIAELQRLTPHFDWAAHLRAFDAPAATEINAAQPEFLREVDRLLATAPLEQWQAYLRWRVLSGAAGFLSAPFSDAAFRFNSIFSGARQRAPRWRRCVSMTSDALGPALGRLYGQRVFTPVARVRAQEMIVNLRARKWRLRTVASGRSSVRAVSSTLSSSTERSTNTVRKASGSSSSLRSSTARNSARIRARSGASLSSAGMV